MFRQERLTHEEERRVAWQHLPNENTTPLGSAHAYLPNLDFRLTLPTCVGA